ncbi:MAG: hypothetical protein WBH09_07565 [Rugosibacter sp.]
MANPIYAVVQSDHLDTAACDLHCQHGAHANWLLSGKSALAGRRAVIPPRTECMVLCANARAALRSTHIGINGQESLYCGAAIKVK